MGGSHNATLQKIDGFFVTAQYLAHRIGISINDFQTYPLQLIRIVALPQTPGLHDYSWIIPAFKHFRENLLLGQIVGNDSFLDQVYQFGDLSRGDLAFIQGRTSATQFSQKVVDNPIGRLLGEFGALCCCFKIIAEFGDRGSTPR